MSLEQQFAAYWAAKFPKSKDVAVSNVARIHGGASRETYRLTLTETKGKKRTSRGLILRRDPPGSLIDTDRRVEFEAYRAFGGSDVPVPEAILLEMEPGPLERPFFVMEMVEGGIAAGPFGADPFGPLAASVGQQFWTILGRIAAADPARTGWPIPPKKSCWQDQLDHWEKVIREDSLTPQPIVHGAIRWLRANPPPPPKRIAVVHGDYRRGNFLHDPASGKIKAILDWEMCHLGDPLEDLGWALDPLWADGKRDLPGGMIARKDALKAWSAASGLKPDPKALHWWELFAHVKGLAIWLSSAHEYVTGANKDPVLGFSGWFTLAEHDKILADAMIRTLQEAP